MSTEQSSTDPTNIWWNAISKSFEAQNIKFKTEIFSAATDSRFIRQIGIPAYGISPMKNTPILLHDHNEYLNERVFLEGVSFYVDLIPRIANAKALGE